MVRDTDKYKQNIRAQIAKGDVLTASTFETFADVTTTYVDYSHINKPTQPTIRPYVIGNIPTPNQIIKYSKNTDVNDASYILTPEYWYARGLGSPGYISTMTTSTYTHPKTGEVKTLMAENAPTFNVQHVVDDNVTEVFNISWTISSIYDMSDSNNTKLPVELSSIPNTTMTNSPTYNTAIVSISSLNSQALDGTVYLTVEEVSTSTYGYGGRRSITYQCQVSGIGEYSEDYRVITGRTLKVVGVYVAEHSAVQSGTNYIKKDTEYIISEKR